MTNSSTIVQRVWNYCSPKHSANLSDPNVLAAAIAEELGKDEL
jgi:hypothetical protein